MIRDLMILWKRVLSSLVDYSGLPMSGALVAVR